MTFDLNKCTAIFPYLIKIFNEKLQTASEAQSEKTDVHSHYLHYNNLENCRYSVKHDLLSMILELIQDFLNLTV